MPHNDLPYERLELYAMGMPVLTLGSVYLVSAPLTVADLAALSIASLAF